jgi:orotate phosphoribosyltransferase
VTTIRPALDIATRQIVAARTEALFRSSGAFREGHFLLKSGRHGDAYVEKFQVLQDPAATSELCAFFAAHGRGLDGETLVDLVAGPTTGGVILAFETARQLGVRSIFAEEVRGDDGNTRREFRRGFRIEAGERVLLVDDILTTGGSLLAMVPAVEAAGGEIVECLVLVDRSGGRSVLTSPATGRTYPLRSLWQLDLPTDEPGPATCPGCAAEVPLHAPGRTGTGIAEPSIAR